MRIEAIAGVPDRLEIVARLAHPFRWRDVSFKLGGGKQYYPYIDVDTLTDRLNEATGNYWDLTIESWEWREKMLVVYGHLEIPGLGRRGGVGVQEHTSAAGNEMGADLVKGVRSDLLKNCLVLFGCGDQVRRMDPLPFDPYDKANVDRQKPYVNNYFPKQDSTPSPARVEALAVGSTVVAMTAPLDRPARSFAPEPICACGEVVGSAFCECRAPELPTMRWVGNKLTTVKAVANG